MLSPRRSKKKIPIKFKNPINYKIGEDFNPYYETKKGWKKIGVRYGKDNVKNYTPVTQWFGSNSAPFYKQLGWKGHNGIDLKAKIGTKVYAMCDGIVDAVSESWGAIWILTDTHTVGGSKLRFKVGYGHLSSIKVKKGQIVKTGDLIGYSGNEGKYTTGPHLHVEVKPQYLNSRGRWYEDVSNGYAGGIDFNIEEIRIIYEQPMLYLKNKQEIVDHFIKEGIVPGVSEHDFTQIKAGNEKIIKRIRDKGGMFFRPHAHGEFYVLPK